MSSNLPATTDGADIMEAVITKGNLADLTPAERVQYYGAVCKSVGLNPLTRPFEYLDLNNGLTLYATRTATDQLRAIHHVSIRLIRAEEVDGVYIVTAEATAGDGRTDQATGAVPLVKEGGQWKTAQSGKRYLAGDGTYTALGPVDRANAIMKCETKAKRRVTLSICGLGWMDESEVETIPHARAATVDIETGEIVDAPVKRQDAPRREEAVADTLDDPQRVLAALHAAAAKYDIDQDAIHALFATQGYASVKDVPVERLAEVTQYLNRGNPRSASDRQKVQERFRIAVMAYEAQASAEAVPEGDGMDDADYAQVVAAIDAEAAPANADRWTN